jgi:hypothetical protein
MHHRLLIWSFAALAIAIVGCFGPSERRPGLALGGEVVETFPTDWSFSDAHRQIAIQVSTPYLIPHSVTIWCAARDGKLYVGARDPDTKSWPGWVDDDPEVRLRIGEQVYEVLLVPIDDDAEIAAIQRAYGAKYELPQASSGDAPPIRYWVVSPRQG